MQRSIQKCNPIYLNISHYIHYLYLKVVRIYGIDSLNSNKEHLCIKFSCDSFKKRKFLSSFFFCINSYNDNLSVIILKLRYVFPDELNECTCMFVTRSFT